MKKAEREKNQPLNDAISLDNRLREKDDDLTIKDVFDFCLETPMLSAYKRPRWYKLVDSLPMTATGKKMHYALKQQAAKDLEAGILKRK